MAASIRCTLLGICVLLMTGLSAHAESRSFADLLAQAKAQAAAGHRWSPPGNNAAETIMRMIDLIPTATPAQLGELSALIESGKPGSLPATSKSVVTTEGRTTEDRATPATSAPPTSEAPAAVATTTPAPPPAPTVHPVPEQNSQLALRQVMPGPMIPDALTPAPMAPGSAAPGPIAPAQAAPGAATPNATVPGSVTPSPVAPIPVAPIPVTPIPVTPIPVTHGPATSGQGIPDAGSRAALLFARGLDAELHGDFSGARRFYAISAQQGDAAAARNLGRLYDPAYLKQAAVGGLDADPALARHWYERALRLGDNEAGPLLEALSMR
jgi:TPR repeat protein